MKRGFLNAPQKRNHKIQKDKILHRENLTSSNPVSAGAKPVITDETKLLDSKINSPSTVIGNNVDIFTQILLCLPVKPLLLFKSVSKRWLSVISDPIFIKKHTKKQYMKSVVVETATENSKLKFVSVDGSSSSSSSSGPFETLDFISDQHIKINQSCNGLWCCSSHQGQVSKRNCTFYICNPSTKQYRRIICGFDVASEKGFIMLLNVSLAFDPLKSPHYKVICVWMTFPKRREQLCDYQIEIYSSETDSWKLSGDVFSTRNIFQKSGVYWNGSLHWIDTWEDENHICFHVDQEIRTGMPPYRPLLYKTDRSNVEYFGECRGRLHLISDYDLLSIYDILEMKTDYTGWIKKFRVNVRDFPYPVVNGGYCVLHVEEVGESFRLVMRIQEQVISCDLHEASFKDLYRFAPQTWNKISQDNSYQYIETLTSV